MTDAEVLIISLLVTQLKYIDRLLPAGMSAKDREFVREADKLLAEKIEERAAANAAPPPVKPFPACPKCGKQAEPTELLMVHHETLVPFKCEACSHSFTVPGWMLLKTQKP